MTTTPQKKLTGPALIERVEANMETHEVFELIKLSGYDDVKEWAEALKEAKDNEKAELDLAKARFDVLLDTLGITAEEALTRNNVEEIVSMSSTIGGLAYRWLTYEYALQNGFEDDQLAAQQKEFEEDLIQQTKLLRVVLGAEAGALVTDTLLVQAHLLAYIRANGWKIEGENGTVLPSGDREQWERNFTSVSDWALEVPLFQEMLAIARLGSTEDQVEAYTEQQRPRCSTVATYLRTQLLDFAQGTNYCESDAYKSDLDSANLYVHYMDKNCEWTKYALHMVVWACLTYDCRIEDLKRSLEFGREIIGAMADNGKVVASEVNQVA